MQEYLPHPSILWSPGAIILYILILSAVYIHFRGKMRFKFFRQIFDHSTFMAPINILMYGFSKVPNTPYVDIDKFEELKIFSENWETLKEEALSLNESQTIKGSDKYNDIGFNSFFRRGWKRFYIKWYAKDYHESAKDKCPKTIELINQVPSIKAAMFVVLPSGSKLPKHRDPYAGSLRYHLGLQTPNSDDCFINVDGVKHSWRDGQAVLFDETYLHYAENKSDKDRLIFFCDVRRPMINGLGRALNSFFSWFIVAAAKSPNDGEKDQTGNLNKAFKYLYQFRLLGKRVKKYNKPLYYTIKYALALAIIYLLLFTWM
jgi:beta-hydroxylase